MLYYCVNMLMVPSGCRAGGILPYTYHRSGGSLLVCLQGRYKFNKYKKKSSWYEQTDTAICSRKRQFGQPTWARRGRSHFSTITSATSFATRMERTGSGLGRHGRGLSPPAPHRCSLRPSQRNSTPEIGLHLYNIRAGFDAILEEGSDSEYDDW